MITKFAKRYIKGRFFRIVMATMVALTLLTVLALLEVEAALPLAVFTVGCLITLALTRIVVMERRVVEKLRKLTPVPSKSKGESETGKRATKQALHVPAHPQGLPVTGRQAADVLPDVHRQAKLVGMVVTRGNVIPKRHIALLGTLELSARLEKRYEVERLHPSTARAQIAEKSLSALIIDQRSLSTGPWGGAESAAGTHLANELFWIIQELKRSGSAVYFVRSLKNADVYTHQLMQRSTLVIDDKFSSTGFEENVKLPLLDLLSEYRKQVVL